MLSAGITYYALFSVAPLFFVAVSVAGLITQGLRLEDNLQSELERVLGSELAQVVALLPAKTSSSRFTGWAATLVGVGVIVYAAVRLFFRLQQAAGRHVGSEIRAPSELARLPAVPSPGARHRGPARSGVGCRDGRQPGGLLVRGRARSVAPRRSAGRWSASPTPPLRSSPDGWCSPSLFKVLPDITVSIRDVWLGALFTTLGWAIAVVLFGLYLSLGGGSAYQAAGAIVVFLVLVHYLSYIFLFGAKLTCVMVASSGSPGDSFFLVYSHRRLSTTRSRCRTREGGRGRTTPDARREVLEPGRGLASDAASMLKLSRPPSVTIGHAL